MRFSPVSLSSPRARRVVCCSIVLAGTLNVGLASPAAAQDATAKSPPATAKSALDDVVARRKDLAAQIDALGKPAGGHSTDPAAVSSMDDELEFLETLDEVYAQQQSRLEQRAELQTEKQKAEESLEAFRKFGPTEAKPYSFLLLEQLRDELADEEARDDVYSADLKPAEQLLQAAQNHFDQCEKERRRAQEKVSENKNKEQDNALAIALKSAQRESQIAKELILVRRVEVEVRTLRRDVCVTRKTLLAETVECIGKDVRFTKQDLQDRLKELTTREAELEGQLKEARTRFKQAELQQAAAIKDLHAHGTPQSTIDLANESWRVARDAQQTAISLLNERIGENKRFHRYWECRFEVENGTAKPAEIAEWQESLGDLVDEIRDNRRSARAARIDSTRSEQAKLLERMRDNEDNVLAQWGEFQGAQWQALRDVCEMHVVQLTVSERWSSRFLEELHAKLQPENGETWWSVAKGQLGAVWVYEVLEIDDRPITIGKIVDLVVCLVLGVLLARFLSRLLGRRLLPRFGLNEGASHAMQSIAFYSLAVLFGVLSFQLVHIPLAAFAFLGGAVAIAVGFGSQDIANNFMSGIIILAEQPIRVGDIIVVDGVQGTVEHIGPRSTRIRTDANHEIIVPNSKLLSDKVTNLTLSDNLIQTTVAVTLPLKISVQQARCLLLQAALARKRAAQAAADRAVQAVRRIFHGLRAALLAANQR